MKVEMLINFESIYPSSSFANVESTMELLCPTCGKGKSSTQQRIGKGNVSSQEDNFPRELIHLLHCIRIHELKPTFGFLPKTVGDNLTSLTFFGPFPGNWQPGKGGQPKVHGPHISYLDVPGS